MGKLEPFDGKQTKWQGLWWHPEINAFTSAVLDLADLRKFKGKIRIQIRKNRFFDNGKNGRPNYNFVIRDANSAAFIPMEIEEDDACSPIEESERLYTEDEVYRIIHGMEEEYGLSYGNNLISDYVY